MHAQTQTFWQWYVLMCRPAGVGLVVQPLLGLGINGDTDTN